MDFNDIVSRIKRLYASINLTVESDVWKKIKTTHTKTPTWGEFHISFNNWDNKDEQTNKILWVVHNLANLKDNLKTKLKLQWKNGNIVEAAIDNSDYLKIIVDLSNQEKHWYPLTQYKRSNKDPKITNIREGLTLSRWENHGFLDGWWQYKNVVVSINADIIDKNWTYLFDLNELIYWSLSVWEEIIKEYNF
jgi:hypothetical protein